MKAYHEMLDGELLRAYRREIARRRAYTRYGFKDGPPPQDIAIQKILDEASMRGLIEESHRGLGGAR